MQINYPKCSFLRVAQLFDVTKFITENKNSQQHVVLNTEMSPTLFLNIYFLEMLLESN